MRDNLIAFVGVVIFLGVLGVANWLTSGLFTGGVLLVMLISFLYFFIRDYDKPGSRKALMGMAGGIVLVASSMLFNAFGWSDWQFILLIVWLIFHFTTTSDSPPNTPPNTPEPPKKPNKPNK